MILFETRKVRHVVGRLERGERIPQALLVLAREKSVTSGWVSGLGALEWVELCEYDQSARAYREARRFDTPCEILALVGNLSFREGEPFAHLHITLSRETDNGIDVIGGHLVDARVFACELRVECWDDLVLGRGMDEATGLALWSGAAVPAAPLSQGREETPTRLAPRISEAGQEAVSWAEVAQVSAEPPAGHLREGRRGQRFSPEAPTRAAPLPDPLPSRKRKGSEEIFDEPIPEKGDWVDHEVFGLCRVDGATAEGHLIIRLPSGVRKPINLDVLRVLAPRLDEGRRIFPLRRRKR